MKKINPNRSKYLQEFYDDINDELNIAIANTSDLRSAYGYDAFKYDYLDSLDFDTMSEEIGNIFEDTNIILFAPEDGNGQDPEDFAYFLEGIRLRVLVDVANDFFGNLDRISKTETYKKMKLLFSKKDITILAFVVEAAQLYADTALAAFKRNEEYIPSDFNSLIKKIKKECEAILTTKSRMEIIDHAYKLEEIIGDTFEGLSDRKFEWTGEQIRQANWFVGVLANMEAHWYFLMLIREEQIVKLDLTNNPNVDHRLDLYEGKQLLLSEAKTMQEAGVSYTSAELKKHKK